MAYKLRFWHLITSVILFPCIVVGFLAPENETETLAWGTIVMGTPTCQSNGSSNSYTCDSTYCPTRTTLPSKIDVLKFSNPALKNCSSSLVGVLPSSAEKSNGALVINMDTKGCSHVKTVGSVDSAKGYTVSFWIKHNCTTTCHLFIISDGSSSLTLDIDNNGLKLECNGNVKLLSVPTSDMEWMHMAMRYVNTELFIYLSGVYTDRWNISDLPTMDTTSGTISFDNYNTGLNPADSVVNLLDVRFYNEALTDREILYVSNITQTQSLTVLYLDCRCPPSHPKVAQSTDENMLTCGNHSDGDTVARLSVNSHLPVFALDNDLMTSWITGPASVAELLLNLRQTYQIDGVTIVFDGTVPSDVVIKLMSPYGESDTITVSVSSDPVQNTVSWIPEILGDMTTRPQFISRLAKDINITLSGHLDTSNFYKVLEVKVHRRKNCFGNSNSPGVCLCQSSSKTMAPDCGSCKEKHYRHDDDLTCNYTCSCSTGPGIIDTDIDKCEDDGGRCLCKANVQNYDCDQCKDFYYNLNSSNSKGCIQCATCDLDGSVGCDKNTGACMCKPSVVGDACDTCSANHYGLRDLDINGCLYCGCDRNGRDGENCTSDGKCTSCKQHVIGDKCDTCEPGFKNLNIGNSRGCEDCQCSHVGSTNATCDSATGQCSCLYPVSGNPTCQPVFEPDLLDPAFGPVAGGTPVTVTGKFFKQSNWTKDINVFVTENTSTFTVQSLEEKKLVFITKSSVNSGRVMVVLQWPKALGQAEDDFNKNFYFTYKVNPNVSEPMNATVFRSGGCYVKIKGRDLDSVAKPMLIAHVSNQEISEGDCVLLAGGKQINCPSPSLVNYPNVSEVRYGLSLDGMDDYRTMNNFPGAMIMVIDDPTVDSDQGLTINNVFSINLVIKGTNLDKACEDNFEIKLGDDVCPIATKTSTEVTCTPAISFPGETKDAALTITIGNFNKTVGIVKIKSFWETWQFIVIAASTGGLILLIIIIIVVVKCCCNRRKRNFTKSTPNTMPSTHDVPRVSQFTDIAAPIVAQKPANPAKPNNYTDIFGMPLQDIDREEDVVENFLRKLGSSLRNDVKSSLSKRTIMKTGLRCARKGAEIRMIDGQFLEGPFTGQDATIKTLVGEFNDFGSEILPRWVGSGLAETLRLRDSYQENLHKSCGITVDSSRFYILYPAITRILKDHLQDRSQEFTTYTLIQICQQIAEAMDYLSSTDIVHRDVATRNCVMCLDGLVKITDSAFSWSLFPDEYMYDSDRERWLPVRWMAQDSLQSGFYSTSTDVWAFGVLMWEVMSRSVLLPYPDVDRNEDIKDHVITGYRLGKPDNVPDEMYNLMMSCWDTNHNKRPAFVRIIESLIDILNPPESPTTIYENQSPDDQQAMYGNIPDDRPAIPSRRNMPAKNGKVNFGYQ